MGENGRKVAYYVNLQTRIEQAGDGRPSQLGY